MTKLSLACVVLLGLCGADGAMAAGSPSGKTFNLTGKFAGSAGVSCKVGGSRNQKFAARRDLSAQIIFNDDGTFTWVNDNLGVGSSHGEWTLSRGGKLELDFEDPSAFSYIWMFGESYSTALPGGSASVSPIKYAFSGKLNASGTQLTVEESGGFKISASAAYGGGSNACSYKLRVTRTYKGASE